MGNVNEGKSWIKEGLTFDDVLLIPQKSQVTPGDVSLKTKLTRNTDKYSNYFGGYGYCYWI